MTTLRLVAACLRAPMVLLLVANLCTPGADAQFGAPRELTRALDEPFAGTMADLDGDGDLDALAASQTSRKVVWYPNDGTGSFGGERVLDNSPQTTHEIVAVDLDGDGIVDVASTGSHGVVRWYRGLSPGQFAPAQAFVTLGGVLVGLLVHDLDLDGDPDLVHASASVGLYVQENLGAGAFGSPVLVTSPGERAYSAAIGDANGDGLPDLVLGSTNEELSWLANLGGLAFGPTNTVALGLRALSEVALEDLDGDGDQDLVAAAELSNVILWFENLGNGSFGAQQVISTESSPFRFVLADVDGDLDPDLLAAFITTPGVLWFRGLAGGAFGPPAPIVSQTSGHGVAAGDIDGDGRIDALTLTQRESVAWHRNIGLGFGPLQSLVGRTDDVRDICAADLDGDGDSDVLAASYGDNKLVVFEQLGGGDFGSFVVIDSACNGCSLVRTADVDGDGDEDVLYVAGQSGTVYLRQNLGGTFGPRQSLASIASLVLDLELADLDADGDPDLVVLADQVKVFQNLGGSFVAPFTLAGLDVPLALELGHVVGSLLPDIVAVSSNQNSVRVHRNLGGLNFAAQVAASPHIQEPTDLALADVDVDGDLDPVWVTSLFSSLAWSENLAHVTFGAGGTIDTLPGPGLHVRSVDLDTDGDEDLLVCLTATNRVYWYENIGGSFGPRHPILLSAYDAAGTETADMDGDGDLDLIVTSPSTDSVIWVPTSLNATIGAVGCGPANPNSTGAPGVIFASGSVAVSADELVLHGRELPPRSFAYFLTSLTPSAMSPVPGSSGSICLGGNIGRLIAPGQVVQVSGAGTVRLEVGTQSLPQSNGPQPIVAGQTWYFQLWHRDLPLTSPSNFSSSIGVGFQ
jgi:hypothetical protein